MNRVYNFCAGPAMLPRDVMEQAQQEFINWQNLGCSVMEVSHRSQDFLEVAAESERLLRELMQIPVNYKVLFMHGGGRGQFSAVPMNLAKRGDSAQYLLSGSWSNAAVKEARKFVQVESTLLTYEQDGLLHNKPLADLTLNPDSSFLHFCPNETVDGIRYQELPHIGEVPLVADMSSSILSECVDVSQYGIIYAGAQKNIGPSGLTIVIVRDDLLDYACDNIPCIFDYKLAADQGSMFNTPPTFAWYLSGLVFKWLKDQGGVSVIEKVNQEKAKVLYQEIDNNDFYYSRVASDARSIMNVPFYLADEALMPTFLQQAKENGLVALEGHRSVGGLRASIYNAMPLEGVKHLVDFMSDFSHKYSK